MKCEVSYESTVDYGADCRTPEARLARPHGAREEPRPRTPRPSVETGLDFVLEGV